jgi:hypothetical protein
MHVFFQVHVHSWVQAEYGGEERGDGVCFFFGGKLVVQVANSGVC